MADVPPEMMTMDREPDLEFLDDELLFRRVSPENLDGNEVSIGAFELPDMSVIREKYGRPGFLLLDDEFKSWGVVAFRVRDIAPNRVIWHGPLVYTLEPRHVPLKYNYPHSEEWVFHDGVHICRSAKNEQLLDPDFHLRWRECLVLASHIKVFPAS
jgi:hypothetical protein